MDNSNERQMNRPPVLPPVPGQNIQDTVYQNLSDKVKILIQIATQKVRKVPYEKVSNEKKSMRNADINQYVDISYCDDTDTD